MLSPVLHGLLLRMEGGRGEGQALMCCRSAPPSGALAASVAVSRQDPSHFGMAPGLPVPGAGPGPW